MKELGVFFVVALTLGGAVVASAENHGGIGHVVVPESSIGRLAGRGKVAHTNVRAFVPLEIPQLAVRAQSTRSAAGAPPYAGVFYETPGSLACVHHLAAAVNGVQSNTASREHKWRKQGDRHRGRLR